jgi:hypothetical protein
MVKRGYQPGKLIIILLLKNVRKKLQEQQDRKRSPQ